MKPARTIPKLELMGVLLGAELTALCADALELPIDKATIWTDSLTALQWLAMPLGQLQILPNVKCKKIKEILKVQQIRHVPGVDNPADIPSRPKTLKELQVPDVFHKWSFGPAWLQLDPEFWPVLKTAPDHNDPEVLAGVKKEFKVFAHKDSNCFKNILGTLSPIGNDKWDARSYSDYGQFLRSVAIRLKFCRFWKQRAIRSRAPRAPRPPEYRAHHKIFNIGPVEREDAQLRLVWYHQSTYFAKEIRIVRKKGSVALSTPLAKLAPLLVPYAGLDGDETEIEILRVGGRIKSAAHLAERARFPFLLHPDDHFTTLFIRYHHEAVLQHTGGIKCLICELHRSAWVVASISYLKRLLKKCTICNRARPNPKIPQMGDLPAYRIPDLDANPRPFQVTAMDCAGPWITHRNPIGRKTRSTNPEKRWLLLFRCATTGLLRLEKIDKMDSDSFLSALLRFCGEGFRPKRLVSDNGTNFIGGATELQAMWLEQGEHIQKTRPDIFFDFSTPLAPHKMGLIERMVQITKSALKTILDTNAVRLTDELLQSCFKQAQGLINDRPISFTGLEPKDPESLTPNHFLLLGGIGGDIVPMASYHIKRSDSTRFRELQNIVQQFWKRLVGELAPQLTRYNKWLTKRENLQVNDVVCILDAPTVSVGRDSRYPLGRITKVFPGNDGIVRKVEVKPAGRAPIIRGLNNIYVVLPATDSNGGAPRIDQSLPIDDTHVADPSEAEVPAEVAGATSSEDQDVIKEEAFAREEAKTSKSAIAKARRAVAYGGHLPPKRKRLERNPSQAVAAAAAKFDPPALNTRSRKRVFLGLAQHQCGVQDQISEYCRCGQVLPKKSRPFVGILRILPPKLPPNVPKFDI